jgi:hypothetical protein
MSQLTPNRALQRLEHLVGTWEMESPQFPELRGRGRTVFEWLDSRAYLVQRSYVPEPAPTSTWIIGSDEAAESYTSLYYDSRGVSRVYRMSFGDGAWKVWREAPGFFQRFTGRFGNDNTTITARWEWSEDGSQWSHDFDLIYTKVL